METDTILEIRWTIQDIVHILDEEGITATDEATGCQSPLHQKMIAAVKSLDDNTLSVHDILLMARCMKMERRGNNWNLKNTRKRDLQILKKLGFEPIAIVSDSN